ADGRRGIRQVLRRPARAGGQIYGMGAEDALAPTVVSTEERSDERSDLVCFRQGPSAAHGATSLRRLIPLQERARTIDGAGLQLRRLLPGKHRDLGVWCQ